MIAPRAALTLLALALGACHGRGVVSLAIDATGTKLSVDHVALNLTYGTTQALVDVPIKGGDGPTPSLPPGVSVSLLFDPSVSGDVKVEAQAKLGTSTVASKTIHFTVIPGKTVNASLDFGVAVGGDDMGPGPDGGSDSGNPDLTLPLGWTVTQMGGKDYNLVGVWVGDTEAFAVGLRPSDQTGIVLTRTLPGGTWAEDRRAAPPYNLLAVHGAGKEVFAVGGGMTMLHRLADGVTWRTELVDDNPNLTSSYLNAVWAAGPNDAYTAGDLDGSDVVVYHGGGVGGKWDKQKPTVQGGFSPTYFLAIWGRGAHDIFASGGGGGLWHSAGTGSWGQISGFGSDDLAGIWGGDNGDVFVATYQGGVWHRQNGAWTNQVVDNRNGLLAIWGSASDNIYAVGENGAFWRWGGQRWDPSGPEPPETTTLLGVHGNAAGHVVVVGREGIIIEGQAGSP